MKRFAGFKSVDELRVACQARGLLLDTHRYDRMGDDYVSVSGGGAIVLYNTFNGRFFGTTDSGIEFTSDSTEHEDQPWFQGLLSFFYVEKECAHG